MILAWEMVKEGPLANPDSGSDLLDRRTLYALRTEQVQRCFEYELSELTTLALLPTFTALTVSGNRAEQSTTTVAIEDGGLWYLVRVENARIETIVKQAYPALKSVKLF